MITKKPTTKRLLFFISCILGFAIARPVFADVLELVNGDHYSGIVIGMTKTNLEFQSEIQGLVKIPRDKVAKITLRESFSRKPSTNAASTSPDASPASSTPNAPKPTGQTAAVVQQLRQGGVDPNMMNQIQQQLLGQSSPEATRMFNEMVGGLTSGSVSMDDIRAQARSAMKDIQAAKKDLGGDAGTIELLDSYLGILQKFVNETETPVANISSAKPAISQSPVAATAVK